MTNASVGGFSAEFCEMTKTNLLCDPFYVNMFYILGRYAIYVVAAIGIVGNVLTLLAAGGQALRSSASWYMCSIAAVDTVYLFMRPVLAYGHENEYVCKLMQAWLFTANTAGTWTVIAMTAERAFVVLFPFKATEFCTVKKAIAITGAIFVLACLGGGPAYAFYDTIKICDLFACLSSNHIGEPLYDFWSHVINSLLFYLPIPSLFLFNTAIVMTLLRAAASTSEMTAATKTTKASKEKELTVTLMSVSVSFLVLNVPFCVNFFVQDLYNYIKLACTSLLHSLIMFDSSAQLLHVIGHAINGYIYCIRSPNFRNQLSYMFKCQTPPTNKSSASSAAKA
ncbi:putative G-protein coupled receptor B0563.6 [Tubulanus polymorphus]|uniref:putative G-protein coupled receptor B0563.6 n=1 Tax=Tubulanus polymorphus TaxID=672921 RepID=UPI003DA59E5B